MTQLQMASSDNNVIIVTEKALFLKGHQSQTRKWVYNYKLFFKNYVVVKFTLLFSTLKIK